MKAIPFNRPTISKKDLISVLEHLIDEDISAPETTLKFAKELGRALKANDRVLLTNSGSTALFTILTHIGIKPGDEIILSPLSESWVLEVIRYFNATPVWIDIALETLQMHHEQLSKKISPQTKAVIINHHFGYPSFMNQGQGKSANEHLEHYRSYYPELAIIEDITSGLFTQYQNQFLGTASDYAFGELGSEQIITMGKGGMVITKNRKTTRELLAFININKKVKKLNSVENINTESYEDNDLTKIPGSIDIAPGGMQSVLGLSELSLVEKFMLRSEQIKQFYQDSVAKGRHSFLVVGEEIISNHFAFPVILNGDMDTAKKLFSKEKIEVRDIISGTCFEQLPYDDKLKNLHQLKHKVILIPIYPTLKKEEIEKISLILNSIQ